MCSEDISKYEDTPYTESVNKYNEDLLLKGCSALGSIGVDIFKIILTKDFKLISKVLNDGKKFEDMAKKIKYINYFNAYNFLVSDKEIKKLEKNLKRDPKKKEVYESFLVWMTYCDNAQKPKIFANILLNHLRNFNFDKFMEFSECLNKLTLIDIKELKLLKEKYGIEQFKEEEYKGSISSIRKLSDLGLLDSGIEVEMILGMSKGLYRYNLNDKGIEFNNLCTKDGSLLTDLC